VLKLIFFFIHSLLVDSMQRPIVYYDFLTFTSFPSSLKAENKRPVSVNITRQGSAEVFFVPLPKPGGVLSLECNIKTKGVLSTQPAWVACMGYDAAGREVDPSWFRTIPTFATDWVKVSGSREVPERVVMAAIRLIAGGSGVERKPSWTWFDDLVLYQDGAPIWRNSFTSYWPAVGAGAGAAVSTLVNVLRKAPTRTTILWGIIGSLIGAGLGVLPKPWQP